MAYLLLGGMQVTSLVADEIDPPTSFPEREYANSIIAYRNLQIKFFVLRDIDF